MKKVTNVDRICPFNKKKPLTRLTLIKLTKISQHKTIHNTNYSLVWGKTTTHKSKYIEHTTNTMYTK